MKTVITRLSHGTLLLGAAVLAACSAGSATAPGGSVGATLPSTTAALKVDLAASAADVSSAAAQPTFHVAPVLLDEPDDMDATAGSVSASFGPHIAEVPAALSHLSTRRLTREAIETAAHGSPYATAQSVSAASAAASDATPLASGSVVATYSPAQIRAAYGLPALPATGAALSTAQAALLGAGQTIYIVDAMHDPNVAAELTAFDVKFGLPACTVASIATNAALPLAAAPTSGCVLSVVYTTPTGAMSAAPPAYDSGWSTEISLDVQWAHATAPLARIVLIEAPDASLNSLLGAIGLANSMGRGVVSMSFGAIEGGYTASVDPAFTANAMSYVASTGDSGAAVDWPAVSPHVLAIGGTSLTYGGTGARREVAWSSTGGGVSAFTPTPSYQTSAVPGMGSALHRNVADVSFNADPATGQYIAVISPGSSSLGWLSAGGTSLAAPQWAGLLAIANAQRAQGAKAALGAPHGILYGTIAGTPGNYSSAFADILQGSDGACASCSAKTGYDDLTGLGTPNAAALLPLLASSVTTVSPPFLAPKSISGTAGVPLSFTVSATAPDAVTFTMSGAPAGMSMTGSGAVSWTNPLIGTYAVVFAARDAVTGLSGSGTYTVTVAAPAPPSVAPMVFTSTAGVALALQVQIGDVNPVTMTLSNAPVGMTSTGNTISWPSPVQGSYTVTMIAKDSKTGLTGQNTLKLTIAAPQPPAVAAATVAGKVGTALSFAVSVTNPNPVNYSLAGAPAGMSISSAGVVSWPTPVAGSYAVTVRATDPKTGLSGQAVYTVTIAVPGPVIKVTPIVGVAGKPVSGTIGISDASATSVSLTISGVPAGMAFALSGQTITATWAAPVTGNYTLSISAVDSAGLKASATVPVTITAR